MFSLIPIKAFEKIQIKEIQKSTFLEQHMLLAAQQNT